MVVEMGCGLGYVGSRLRGNDGGGAGTTVGRGNDGGRCGNDGGGAGMTVGARE